MTTLTDSGDVDDGAVTPPPQPYQTHIQFHREALWLGTKLHRFVHFVVVYIPA